MTDNIKGRFVFIPDDGGEAYEIDINSVLEDAAELISESRWERFKGFFRREERVVIETAPTTTVNLSEQVCKKLEQLFGTAEWRLRDDEDQVPCFIINIYPRLHGEGWEPMVTLTVPGGSIQEMSLGDLITDFMPYEPATEGLH
jgi:hypothetical protein